MSGSIEETILDLLQNRKDGRSICPTDVAKALDPDGFQRKLGLVKAAAVGMARRGGLWITRKGKPVNPEKFKGVYRLKLPEPGVVLDFSADLSGEDGAGEEE